MFNVSRISVPVERNATALAVMSIVRDTIAPRMCSTYLQTSTNLNAPAGPGGDATATINLNRNLKVVPVLPDSSTLRTRTRTYILT